MSKFLRSYKALGYLIGLLLFIGGAMINENASNPKIWYLVATVLTGLIWWGALVLVHGLEHQNRPTEAVHVDPPHNSVSATGTAPPTTQPEKKESVSKQFTIKRLKSVQITVGSNLALIELDHNGNMPEQQLFGLGPSFRVANEQILLSGKITDGIVIAELHDNELICPAGWDLNEDDSLMEVVNETGHPVLQVWRSTDGLTIDVTGAFIGPSGDIWMLTGEGSRNATPEEVARFVQTVPAMFKYPSSQFDGQRSKTPAPQSPPMKS